MPRNAPRLRRIADQIQRELAELIRLEVKDPRVGMVTLTDVEVTADCAHAKVYFTLLGSEQALRETEQALQHAAGFLRTQLSHRLRLRTVPQLRFVYDASVERGARLSRLIDEAVQAAPPDEEAER
ncbi:MAG: 30S ribosome-binding factor RbfA [Burkholderiales bacterium]|nr:30S ribosome-binding factor RbfA [Burkholderiales bacterium]